MYSLDQCFLTYLPSWPLKKLLVGHRPPQFLKNRRPFFFFFLIIIKINSLAYRTINNEYDFMSGKNCKYEKRLCFYINIKICKLYLLIYKLRMIGPQTPSGKHCF